MTAEVRCTYYGGMQANNASELIDIAGGTAAVARYVNVSSPSVSEWRKAGIPLDKRVLLAPLIERRTNGRVRRWHVCPENWFKVWDHLVDHPDAPPVPAEAGTA